MGTENSGWFRADPTKCRSGKHVIAQVGESPDGHCKGCLHEWHRANYARNRATIAEKRRIRFKETYIPHPKAERAQCEKGHTYAITGRYADGHCAECGRERDRARDKERREAIAKSPELKTAQQRYDRSTRLQRRYGLTNGEYERMHDAQGGLCAVCRKPETTVRNGTLMRLSVDHNHVTGQKRGLVCNNCNRALGLAGDDTAILQALIDYLNRYRSE